jgi:hypothetical protein
MIFIDSIFTQGGKLMVYLALLGAYALVTIIVVIAVYVVLSLGFYKALKRLGYANAWMGWVPVANLYALADVAADGQDNINVIGTVTIPAMLYKFWWAIVFVANFVPAIGSILAIAIQVICFGNIFIRLFARMSYTSQQEQQVIGYISGLLPIVGAIKFLATK